MGNFRFHIASPEEIEINPEALAYLERGANGFGNSIGVQQAIKNSKVGLGKFILIFNASLLRGAIYLTITNQESGKIMTSVLLGGDDFDEWYMDLREFYYKLAIDEKCDEFWLMGRRGFKKYFPELNEVATIFRVILKSPA